MWHTQMIMAWPDRDPKIISRNIYPEAQKIYRLVLFDYDIAITSCSFISHVQRLQANLRRPPLP